jgi:hypothetical protein
LVLSCRSRGHGYSPEWEQRNWKWEIAAAPPVSGETLQQGVRNHLQGCKPPAADPHRQARRRVLGSRPATVEEEVNQVNNLSVQLLKYPLLQIVNFFMIDGCK